MAYKKVKNDKGVLMVRVFACVITLMAALPLVTACTSKQLAGKETGFSDSLPPWKRSEEKQKPLDKAHAYYSRGDYGNAEKYYRKAVEKNPKEANAWLGLAATYDRLRRFDNASRAYDIVIKYVGFTPTVLNNLGYHYILRGEYDKARKTLKAAHMKDPDNQFIKNNLDLLEEREERFRKNNPGANRG